MSIEMKSFLNLLYSLARQYVSWYEKEIKRSSNLSAIAKVD